VAAALEVLGGAGSFLEAARAFCATHESCISSKPLGEAVALYLDSKADLRDSTLKSYRYSLEKSLVTLHAKPMADVTTAEIEAILSPKAPTARAMHKRIIRVFWKWASILPRQWTDMVTVDGLEAIRNSSDADIVMLKPSEVAFLLRAAEKESPACGRRRERRMIWAV